MQHKLNTRQNLIFCYLFELLKSSIIEMMKVFWRSLHLAQELCRHQLVNTCLGFDILHLISDRHFFWHCLTFYNSFIFISICLTNAEKQQWKWCICTVWLFTQFGLYDYHLRATDCQERSTSAAYAIFFGWKVLFGSYFRIQNT